MRNGIAGIRHSERRPLHEQPYLEYPDETGYVGHAADYTLPGGVVNRLHDYRIADKSAMLDALP